MTWYAKLVQYQLECSVVLDKDRLSRLVDNVVLEHRDVDFEL